MVVSELHSRYS